MKIMKINYQATKAKFDSLFNQSQVARAGGHSVAMFRQVLLGTYPAMSSSAARACIETLRKLRDLDGEPILVLEPGDEEAKAA